MWLKRGGDNNNGHLREKGASNVSHKFHCNNTFLIIIFIVMTLNVSTQVTKTNMCHDGPHFSDGTYLFASNIQKQTANFIIWTWN